MQNLVDVNTSADKAALVNRDYPLTLKGNTWLVDGMWRVLVPISGTKLFDFDAEMFTERKLSQSRINTLNKSYASKGGRRAKRVNEEVERNLPKALDNQEKLVADKVNLEDDGNIL